MILSWLIKPSMGPVNLYQLELCYKKVKIITIIISDVKIVEKRKLF